MSQRTMSLVLCLSTILTCALCLSSCSAPKTETPSSVEVKQQAAAFPDDSRAIRIELGKVQAHIEGDPIDTIFIEEQLVSETTFQAIARCKHLKSFGMRAIFYFDPKLLSMLPHGIISLRLEGSSFDNRSISNIQHLTDLTELDVNSSRIDDIAVQNIASLFNLKVLDLSMTKITDRGLESFCGAMTLESLDLYSTNIGDEGLAALRNLRLVSLRLDKTNITSNGLASLREMQSLKRLIVRDTQIGDSAIDVIIGFRSLRFLDLRYTKISDSGLSRIKAELPFATILP